jgi:LPS biosynthesis protein
MKRELSLEEIKGIQLDILSQVANYCDRNGLRYFLAYGTLLGAVRHKGYIPWDDDIDIMMPRPDYMQFINSFNESCCYLKVVSHYNDTNYPYAFAKVFNNTTSLIEYVDMKYLIGVNIDVFPLDGLPELKREASRHLSKIRFYCNLKLIKTIKYNKKRVFYKSLLLCVAKFFLILISYRKLILKIEKLALNYDYANNKFVGNCVEAGGRNEFINKEIFKEKTVVFFEGKKYYAPLYYHEYLSNFYGNYMQFPPVEDRVTHHAFIAYKVE